MGGEYAVETTLYGTITEGLIVRSSASQGVDATCLGPAGQPASGPVRNQKDINISRMLMSLYDSIDGWVAQSNQI